MTETVTQTVLGPPTGREHKGEDIPPAGAAMARKGSMGPPADPTSSSAPRMTRLPSLQQISDRLHTPSPLSIHSPSSSNIDRPPSTTTDLANLPKPKLALDSAVPTAASIGSPGRLKLPASAMMRSHSSSSASGSLPTINKIAIAPPSKEDGDSPRFSDPFGAADVLSMARAASKDGYIKGYKDVPSLDQIRQRVGPTTAIRGSVSHPEEKPRKESMVIPELVTPQLQLPSPPDSAASTSSSSLAISGKGIHPLAHSWTLYFDAKGFKPAAEHVVPKEGGDGTLTEYEKSLVTVGKFDTVEGFARYLNNVRLPSQLAKNSNYHMFKNGIRPMWEDPANADGGKWVMHFRNAPHLLDHAWANLTMALVGEVLDPTDEICGVVASSKPRSDRVQVWTRGKDDVTRVNELGRRIVEIVGLEGREVECMSLEFQYNASTASPPPNTFLHIPFASRSASTSFAAPPTPGRLAPHTLNHHPSLPQIPRSPLSPRSPLARQADTLAPPPLVRRPSAGDAFSGPMGSGGRAPSPVSPRRGSAALAEAK